jgi:hypothetical protein
VKLDFNAGIAQKALLFLGVFPTAYFLSAPYTEGLFFALVISSFYYSRLSKWPLAGFLSFFAALTRIAGLFMLPVLMVEYLHQKGWKPRKTDLNAIWTFSALGGFLVYLNINSQIMGNAFAFTQIQLTHWYNTLDPVLGFSRAINWSLCGYGPENLMLGVAPLVFAALGIIALAGGFIMQMRSSYMVYMILTWMLAVSTSFWISVPRYVMAMFPMFILMALFSRRKITTVAIAMVSAVGLCYFTVAFALGQWAF